jgi:hypothetical protein
MQSISRVPDIDLSRYAKRTSRRGSSKYEQNLGTAGVQTPSPVCVCV